MATNPLQQYFRQPKVYIKLPSGGAYSKPGNIQGDVTHMPVYGMTGMDEIIMKTPDSLLTGQSTAQVITSCCPNIKDPWDIPIIDINAILAAIKIATFGNTLSVTSKCPGCQTDNDYDLDLNKIIEHYMSCQYNNSVSVGSLKIKLHPLDYKTTTEFGIRNFQLQQQMVQADQMEQGDARTEQMKRLFEELGKLQTDIIKSIIESIDTGAQVVTESEFINEWVDNCDKTVFDNIREQNIKNNEIWSVPPFDVVCENCGKQDSIKVELDESNFFVKA